MILYRNEIGRSITFHSPQDAEGVELDVLIVSIENKQINSIVTEGTVPLGSKIYNQVEVFVTITDMIELGLYNLYVVIKESNVVLLQKLVRIREK